jgi:LAS superfamily LD-carboxypeptidase LdcB
MVALSGTTQAYAFAVLTFLMLYFAILPFGLVDDGASDEDIYFETESIITEEQQISLDLITYAAQGDSEGTEEVTPGTTGTTGTTGAPVNTNGQNAGGSGDRRFQQQLTIRGRVVKNGEIPTDLLGKVVIGKSGYFLEKHAAVKFTALMVAFKAQFGKDFEVSGPYRTIKVSNDIFDWQYFNLKGAARKIGTCPDSPTWNGKSKGCVAAAKPGTSKHGWGQAMDLGGFGNGPGNPYFDWMEINARKYGWINPAWAKKAGAGYEPWHWEYIGDDLFAA